MQIAAIAVIRNEIDIVRPFLEHLAALFDVVFLLDHKSTDGTEILLRAACAARAGWNYWRVDLPGHHQALCSGFAMRHVFETTAADMVLFLDADEFLDVPDRPALERALAEIVGPRVAGRFGWVNCLPERLDGVAVEFGQTIWAHAADPPFYKVAVPRRLYDATGGAVRPSSGNHRTEPNDGQPVTYHVVGDMLHLPLRSVAQARLKTVTGALAVLARRGNASHESVHWFDALRLMSETGMTNADLIGLARAYGRKQADAGALNLADLPRLGFVRRHLEVARLKLDLPPLVAGPDPWRVIAGVLCDWHARHDTTIELVLQGSVLREAGGAHNEASPAP